MRAPSAERVAFRSLLAGGDNFVEYGEGSDYNKVFDRLVDEARREGYRPYSGTIAEKAMYGVVLRAGPMTRDEAERFADRDINLNKKFGPAFGIPISGGTSQTKAWKIPVRAETEEEARRNFAVWATSLSKDAVAKVKKAVPLGRDYLGFPQWEVRGSVTVPGPPVGFLFYGIASS